MSASATDVEARASAQAEATALVAGEKRVRWREPEEPVGLFALRTFGLTLATFGVYAFWAQVESRARLVGSIEIDGKRMSYHGRGIEGLVSFVLAAIMTVAAVSLFFAMVRANNIDVSTLAFGSFRWQRLWISLPVLFLLGSVTYRKRHHILKRIRWEGTPFRLTGEAWSYAWLHFWTAFLVPLTAGLAAPWRAMRLERRKTNEMAHGAKLFRYVGKGKDVYKAFGLIWVAGGVTYLATVLVLAFTVGAELVQAIETRSWLPLMAPGVPARAGSIIVAGLLPFLFVVAIYRAVWVRHQISSIGFADGRIELSLPIWRFAMVTFLGAMARLATLGAAGPVVDQKLLQMVLAHLTIDGQPFAAAEPPAAIGPEVAKV